ncbi:MAG: CRISPR-associated endonuclease Cas4g/Cas1g [Candidatus Entotheonellia bacterium]
MEAQDTVYLPISHVAEVAYCPRNFYYRAVEKIDLTDARMAQGSIAEHKREARARIMREGTLQVRAVTVSSETLGVIGVIDVLEESEFPCPVEYKTGTADEGLYERVQLCLQAMCLEETLGCTIPYGYLYYAGSRKRVCIDFDEILREKTIECVTEARQLMESPTRPEPVNDWRCPGCSLLPICMPAEDRFLDGAGPKPRKPLPSLGVERVVYVDEQGAYLRKDGSRLAITKDRETLASVPLAHVDQLVLVGNVNLSTPLLKHLLRYDVEVVLLNSYGKYEGRFTPELSKNSVLRLRQYERSKEEIFRLQVAREMVLGKVQNMRTFLMRGNRTRGSTELEATIPRLTALLSSVTYATSVEALLGLEGAASHAYFQGFSELLGKDVGFDFQKRTRRPPKDPVNALLSLGYTLLCSDCITAAQVAGLDPYVGFYHIPIHGRPALALDLMEEFRVLLVDSVVLSLINKGSIRPDDFEGKYGGWFLTERGREKFYAAYGQRKNTEVTHPIFEYTLPYRRVLELQARLLSKVVMDDIPTYQSFVTR